MTCVEISAHQNNITQKCRKYHITIKLSHCVLYQQWFSSCRKISSAWHFFNTFVLFFLKNLLGLNVCTVWMETRLLCASYITAVTWTRPAHSKLHHSKCLASDGNLKGKVQRLSDTSAGKTCRHFDCLSCCLTLGFSSSHSCTYCSLLQTHSASLTHAHSGGVICERCGPMLSSGCHNPDAGPAVWEKNLHWADPIWTD